MPDVRRFDHRSAVSALVELVETTAQGRPDVLAWYLSSLLGGLEVRVVEVDRVPGAEVVALPGPDHGWWVDPQEITREIERFLTKLWADGDWDVYEPERILATRWSRLRTASQPECTPRPGAGSSAGG
ncbi:MAG: hypothetical protein WKF73_01200 [Nocardioidaceae bacterium]